MRIGKTETIHVTDSRPDFDKASAEAYDLALFKFGISVDGHSDNIDFNYTDSICVKFLSYTHTGSMVGHEHIYQFEAWIERNEDE